VPQRCSVLLVEDDPGVQELLRRVLTDEGNEVAVARDGEGMRAAFAADRFDVVIIDVRLPGTENGIALARHAADCGCGVVLITGDHGHLDALARTGHRYLLKPFRVEALLEATEQVVQATQARCTVKRGSRARE
jgi:DNA-binding NtrC family response regulator